MRIVRIAGTLMTLINEHTTAAVLMDRKKRKIMASIAPERSVKSQNAHRKRVYIIQVVKEVS